MKETKEMVSHPAHYQSESGLEVIDVIEAFTAKLSGVEAFDTGNIIKYICRWHEKNGVEDLEKARWYLNDLIDHVNGKKAPDTSINFPTRRDAETALSVLDEVIQTYGLATVADLYDYIKAPCPDYYKTWGWVDLKDAAVKKSGENYIITLPKPYKIN